MKNQRASSKNETVAPTQFISQKRRLPNSNFYFYFSILIYFSQSDLKISYCDSLFSRVSPKISPLFPLFFRSFLRLCFWFFNLSWSVTDCRHVERWVLCLCSNVLLPRVPLVDNNHPALLNPIFLTFFSLLFWTRKWGVRYMVYRG